MKADGFLASTRWIHGPEFLSKPEEEWPKSDLDLSVISSDDLEVKRDLAVNCITKDTEDYTNYLINYYSTWVKLKRTVAWFLRLKQLLKQLTQKRKEIYAAISITENDPEKEGATLEKRMHNFKTVNRQSLYPKDYAKAEQAIIHFFQGQRFKDEIDSLKASSNVKKDSEVYKLYPVWEDGVLRVGGHLSEAAMPEETKHPVILSKDLHVSTLILHHIHLQLGHGGRNHMLCHLRKK